LIQRGMARAAHYQSGLLYVEGLPVEKLAAEFGTPLYVYSTATIREQFRLLERNLRGLAPDVLICYALKANANMAIGKMLAAWGAGADVVSGGELYLALRMGFAPERIVFAGVGKTRREMAEALEAGIHSFHVESVAEADLLEQVAAEMGQVARLAVRVNPDVDAGTHPHITTGTKANKFGVSPQVALEILRKAAISSHLEPAGLHVHIGSQLARVRPVLEAVGRVLALWDVLASEGILLRELDIGGGLGIAYLPDDAPEGPEALAAGLRPMLHGRDLQLLLEPGRFLVGPAGVLLTKVLYLKEAGDVQTLAVVDAGMNDLLRPALYDAWHPVWPAQESQVGAGPTVDIVGPVCESADVLAQQRKLGMLQPGALLAIGQAGAYGFSMASQYNGRPRPAEVLVDGEKASLVRKRETYNDLVSEV
jgi:diaminopimelate decarboxylase